jgi:hypothetical protein
MLLPGWPAQGQRGDVQACGGQPGGHLGQDPRPGGDRQDDPACRLIYGRIGGGEWGEHCGELAQVLAR